MADQKAMEQDAANEQTAANSTHGAGLRIVSRTNEVEQRADQPVVVDATNHIAGRLCSHVAKLLIGGTRVSVINCGKIMISGTRSNIIHEYRKFLEINSIINPKHGPVHYRRPDTIITKMVRGMLPHAKKPSGRLAHKRLRAYIDSPKELRPLPKIQFENARIKKDPSNYTTMAEMCRVIGWTE